MGEIMMHLRRATPILTAFALISCGGSGGPKLHPVRGKVLFQNAPAEGAVVVFHPVAAKDGAAPKPSGTTGADGSFTLATHPHGEGAPAGEYIVLVTWYPPNSREIENARNKLPNRYATVESPLRAIINDAPTELKPFALTK